MSTGQPTVTDQRGRRQFACSPACVLAFIVNQHEQFLMLSNPRSGGRWEVVNGALEANETILEGVLREVKEEAGAQVVARPLAVLHTFNYPYDAKLRYMINTCYLLAYQSGMVVPGDDMQDSRVGWFSMEQIERGEVDILVPTVMPWLFRRAIVLYRLLKDEQMQDLEISLERIPPLKYER